MVVYGLFIVFCVTNAPWVLLFISTLLEPSPPKPEIRYGEFPFRLVYELNGEQIIIEDTIICEYGGIGMNAGHGKHRTWKFHLLSSGEEVPNLGIVILADADKAIHMNIGGPYFYMGDWEMVYKWQEIPEIKEFDNTFRMIPTVGLGGGVIRGNDLYEKYGIRVIEWTHAPPIENSFTKRFWRR